MLENMTQLLCMEKEQSGISALTKKALSKMEVSFFPQKG